MGSRAILVMGVKAEGRRQKAEGRSKKHEEANKENCNQGMCGVNYIGLAE